MKKTLLVSIIVLSLFVRAIQAQTIDTLSSTLSYSQQHKSKWNFIPIIYSQPEIGVGFGARAVKVYRDNKSTPQSRPSTIPLTIIYTTKKQTIANIRSDLWFKNHLYHFSSLFGYQNYPFKFYGIGNEASEKAEEFYTTRIAEAFLAFEKRVLKGLYLGTRYEFRYENTTKKEPNKLLEQQQVVGSEGQRSSGLGATITYDTRYNIYQPMQGQYHQLTALVFPTMLGSKNAFNRYRIDFRKYTSIFKSHIIALQAQFTLTTGTIPFQQLAQIGGPDLIRGYFQGRYRDRNMMVYQAEYRLPLQFRFSNRFKLVGFSSAGQVAKQLEDFRLTGFKYAGGIGLRYRFNEEGLNVRLDVGHSQKTFFYFAFNEAF